MATPVPPIQPLPAGTPSTAPAAVPVKKKRGPKPKTMEERIAAGTYKPKPPKTRAHQEVSMARKVTVIKYLLHHRIFAPAVH